MDDFDTQADRYFIEYLDTRLDTLLAPIASPPIAGESLNGSSVYASIRAAREEDDPSLPLGAWEYELKRADWNAVCRLCIQALSTRSKDLQLAVWLFEASVVRDGFQAIAPGLYMISQLCELYWDNFFPLDSEHRENLLRWVNDKFPARIRRLSMTAAGHGTEYSWADWEQAQRNEQIIANQGGRTDEAIEGATIKSFHAVLSASVPQSLIDNASALEAALAALSLLEEILVEHLGDTTTSFATLRGLIEDIGLMLHGEIRKRGLLPAIPTVSAQEPSPQRKGIVANTASAQSSEDARAEAYIALARIAETLARIEPHSPVPYLLQRAVQWGQMNTAELYEELFMRCQGHIGIFEMLGLDARAPAQSES